MKQNIDIDILQIQFFDDSGYKEIILYIESIKHEKTKIYFKKKVEKMAKQKSEIRCEYIQNLFNFTYLQKKKK